MINSKTFLVLFWMLSMPVLAGPVDLHDTEDSLPNCIYPTLTHDIDSLCGPDLDRLDSQRKPTVPHDKKELYTLVLDFMSHYIWLRREDVLYGLCDDASELYTGVQMNVGFKLPNGQKIVVIENSAHPHFVTRGGETVFDYWAEFFRQKNLCFINDLWAALLPEEQILPGRDFYLALRRLASDLFDGHSKIITPIRRPEELGTILRDMVVFAREDHDLRKSEKSLLQQEELSKRLYSWAIFHLMTARPVTLTKSSSISSQLKTYSSLDVFSYKL